MRWATVTQSQVLQTTEVYSFTVWKLEAWYPGEGVLPLQFLNRNLASVLSIASAGYHSICWLPEMLSVVWLVDLCGHWHRGLRVCACVFKGLLAKTPATRFHSTAVWPQLSYTWKDPHPFSSPSYLLWLQRDLNPGRTPLSLIPKITASARLILKIPYSNRRICWLFFFFNFKTVLDLEESQWGYRASDFHSAIVLSPSFLPSLTPHVIRTPWPKPRKSSGCDAIRECADFIQISPSLLSMALFPSGIQARIQAAGSAHSSDLLWQGLGSSLAWPGPSERALVISVMKDSCVGLPRFSSMSGWDHAC